MRINKGQANLDGLDITTLQTLQTNVIQAINNRLAGNGTATVATREIEVNGLALKTETLEDLRDFLQDVQNAIAKKAPGSTFTQADFGGGLWGGGLWPSGLR